ncbi:MAG TPA: type VI secretion system tube protein Hcp [Acidimicrobiales bacterium]|nr:type VI secretion system tube protein Hcp [Acidimicrobiales bacterium]
MATISYFLKIAGVTGESVDPKHKGEIDVESWSWGESNSGATNGTLGPGKAVAQDFHFVTSVGRQSPQLLVACASGSTYKEAVLTCRKNGPTAFEFLKILMFNLYVSSYQVGGSGASDNVPLEQVSLHFQKIEMEEFDQNADGSPVMTFGGYNFATNQVVPPPATG